MAHVLEMAEGVDAGAPIPDRFEETAAAGYWLRSTFGRVHLPRPLGPRVGQWVLALRGGAEDRRVMWAKIVKRPLDVSGYGFIARVERRFPRLGRIWRFGLRFARLPIALAIAAPTALALRRALRRAGVPSDPA